MDSTNFDKMFNRKAAEYLNANGKKDDDLMEREVRIPEHMLPKKIVLDDDDTKERNSSVSWATNPLNVVNPNFVRRSERRVGPQANSGKTA